MYYLVSIFSGFPFIVQNFVLVEKYDKSKLNKIQSKEYILIYQNVTKKNYDDTLKKIYDGFASLGVQDYAFIYHDKDESKHNHIHLYVKFKERKRILQVSKYFKCDVNEIERCFERNVILRYLIHVDDLDKYQYKVNEIVTNIPDIYNICRSNVINDSDALEQLIDIQQCFNSFNDFATYLINYRKDLLKSFSKHHILMNNLIRERVFGNTYKTRAQNAQNAQNKN